MCLAIINSPDRHKWRQLFIDFIEHQHFTLAETWAAWSSVPEALLEQHLDPGFQCLKVFFPRAVAVC